MGLNVGMFYSYYLADFCLIMGLWKKLLLFTLTELVFIHAEDPLILLSNELGPQFASHIIVYIFSSITEKLKHIYLL